MNASSPADVSLVAGQSMCDAIRVTCKVPMVDSAHLESPMFDLRFIGLMDALGAVVDSIGSTHPVKAFVSHGP